MTSLRAVFHRAVFALALVGTGIAGPQLLPAPAVDAGDGCRLVQTRTAAQAEGATTRAAAAATGSARRSHAAVAAMRD